MSTPLTDLVSAFTKKSSADETNQKINAEMIMQLVDIKAKKDLYLLDVAKDDLRNAVKDEEHSEIKLAEAELKHKILYKDSDYSVEHTSINTTKDGKIASDDILSRYERNTEISKDRTKKNRDKVLMLLDEIGKSAILKESIKNLPFTAGKSKIERETYGPEDFTAKILSKFSSLDESLVNRWLKANAHLLEYSKMNQPLADRKRKLKDSRDIQENRENTLNKNKQTEQLELRNTVTVSPAVQYYNKQVVDALEKYPEKDKIKERTNYMVVQLSNYGVNPESSSPSLAQSIMSLKDINIMREKNKKLGSKPSKDDLTKHILEQQRLEAKAFKDYIMAFGTKENEGKPKLITAFMERLQNNLASFIKDSEKDDYINKIRNNFGIDLTKAAAYQTESMIDKPEVYFRSKLIDAINKVGGIIEDPTDARADAVYKDVNMQSIIKQLGIFYKSKKSTLSKHRYKDELDFVKKNLKIIQAEFHKEFVTKRSQL